MSETNGQLPDDPDDGSKLFGRKNHRRLDSRLLERAVKNGWIEAPWDINEPKRELIDRVREAGDISLADRAKLATFELLESGSDRAKGIGTKCALAMQAQDLAVARMEQIERLKDNAPFGNLIPGVNIEAAQITFNVPDNGRGPKRLEYDDLNGSDG